MVQFNLTKRDWRSVGREVANGIFDVIAGLWLTIIILGWIVTAVQNWTGGDKDDSDPRGGFSNMSVRTDALTGCQYLNAASLTPRLDAMGHQICKARP